jgi:protein-tyrosine kinase
MESVRQALDRARVERVQIGDAARAGRGSAPWATETSAASPTQAATPGCFVYTHTRIFTPSAEVLEDNRILDPSSDAPAAAAFRMLRTQVLQRMDTQGWRSIAIFGATANDGKTTMAINLAVNLASDHSHSVLLVDFDFKRPTIAARLGLTPEFGSDDALTADTPVENCFYHPEGLERLVVLPARRTLAKSSEILAGPRSRQLVAELRNRYPNRIVVFDLPPVLAADDALAFAPSVDCGLVVAAESRTRRNDLVRTVELLHNTPLVGTVLNCAAAVQSSY